MNLKGKHFINLEDFNKDEVLGLLELAQNLKKDVRAKKDINLLKNKSLVMYFSKPSLRTRLSFEIGMSKLGGQAITIKQDEIILGQRESVADVARVISGYADGVTIRTFAHSDVEEFAKYSSIPVINSLTDFSHPCQIMADLLTIKETFGSFSGLKLAYIGDGNNVTNSLLIGCSLLGINISVATPQGYEPNKNCVTKAEGFAKSSNSNIEIINNPTEAVKNANIVCTDTWTSMGQESESEKRKEIFKPYQVNSNLLKNAEKKHIILHCLPAHKGEEITEEVFELHAKTIFNEAENRMHAQMAILASIM
jgi:ornithine carbamoyltransferase